MVVARNICRSSHLWWKSHNNHHHQRHSVRAFFASSTDHTLLLQNAKIHRFNGDNNGSIPVCNYVLAADGMDLEMVQKVPQLHLARIVRQGHLIYGATVVNSTLGTLPLVCDRLMDAALEDAWAEVRPSKRQQQQQEDEQGSTVVVQAKSTLHGLSEWVQKGIEGKGGEDSVELFASLLKQEKQAELQAIQDILSNGNKTPEDMYEKGKQEWETLAQEFVKTGIGEEASLYQSKGGECSKILHHADTSSYASTSGGTMALFHFPL